MTALPPMSLQIGGLPPGHSPSGNTTNGPELFSGILPWAPLSIVQQVAAATTIATPPSLAVTIAATGVGNHLIAFVAVAGTGVASVFTTPANWAPIPGSSGENAANTLAVAGFKFIGNPGAITTVTFTVSNANGIAAIVYEIDDTALTGLSDVGYNVVGATQVTTNSSATPGATAYTPSAGSLLLIGIECDVTGQAYTPANTGAGWVTDATATSTTGATLIVIRGFHAVSNPVQQSAYQLKGTLAGAIANGAVMASWLLGASYQLFGNNPITPGWFTPPLSKVGANGGGQ